MPFSILTFNNKIVLSQVQHIAMWVLVTIFCLCVGVCACVCVCMCVCMHACGYAMCLSGKGLVKNIFILIKYYYNSMLVWVSVNVRT